MWGMSVMRCRIFSKNSPQAEPPIPDINEALQVVPRPKQDHEDIVRRYGWAIGSKAIPSCISSWMMLRIACLYAPREGKAVNP